MADTIQYPPFLFKEAMDRHREQVIVKRDKSILMVKHRFKGNKFWALPGGGVEADETPAEAALCELEEECCVTGKLVKQLSEYVYLDGSRVFTFQVDIGEQEPRLGSDLNSLLMTRLYWRWVGFSWMR